MSSKVLLMKVAIFGVPLDEIVMLLMVIRSGFPQGGEFRGKPMVGMFCRYPYCQNRIASHTWQRAGVSFFTAEIRDDHFQRQNIHAQRAH